MILSMAKAASGQISSKASIAQVLLKFFWIFPFSQNFFNIYLMLTRKQSRHKEREKCGNKTWKHLTIVFSSNITVYDNVSNNV